MLLKLITTSGDRVVGGVDVSKIVFESDGVGDIRFPELSIVW